MNKVYLVRWTEKRYCKAEVIAADEDHAIDIVYNGNLDESDIEVASEEILSIDDTYEVGN